MSFSSDLWCLVWKTCPFYWVAQIEAQIYLKRGSELIVVIRKVNLLWYKLIRAFRSYIRWKVQKGEAFKSPMNFFWSFPKWHFGNLSHLLSHFKEKAWVISFCRKVLSKIWSFVFVEVGIFHTCHILGIKLEYYFFGYRRKC